MFPSPIERFSPIYQWIYKIALPVALIIWLLPLIAVAVTSVRSAGDITSGNYWGWPTSFNFIENYTAVFNNSPIGKYIFNSFKVTIPTVIGAIVLSSMTGFALAVYKFKANLLIFFMFVAGNFVPFQILMVPVRDLTLSMGFYNTTTGQYTDSTVPGNENLSINSRALYKPEYESFHIRTINDAYIQNVSIPRLRKFQKKFPDLLKTRQH